MSGYAALVGLVAVERGTELVLARRHLAWARQRGGREFGHGHFPFMVTLHTGLLAGCLLEPRLASRPFVPALGWPMLGLVLGSQALRWWCIRSLGHRWNTRVVVVPGLPLVHAGPYRLLPHPNYVAVVIEGLALPLVHSGWLTAASFTALNLPLLVTRVRVEDAALRWAARGATPSAAP